MKPAGPLKRFLKRWMAALAAVTAVWQGAPARAVFESEPAAARLGRFFTREGVPDAADFLGTEPPPVAGAPIRESLLPPALWTALPRPSAAALALLRRRLPTLDRADIRELTPNRLDDLLRAAATAGETGLDLFSDPGFQRPRVYYIGPAALAQAFSRFDLASLAPTSGLDRSGRPFRMLAILAGGGRVTMIFDRDSFTFSSPAYRGYWYEGHGIISYVIKGAADFSLTGLGVDLGIIHPSITGVCKIGPRRMRADTSLGSLELPLWPIVERAGGLARATR